MPSSDTVGSSGDQLRVVKGALGIEPIKKFAIRRQPVGLLTPFSPLQQKCQQRQMRSLHEENEDANAQRDSHGLITKEEKANEPARSLERCHPSHKA